MSGQPIILGKRKRNKEEDPVEMMQQVSIENGEESAPESMELVVDTAASAVDYSTTVIASEVVQEWLKEIKDPAAKRAAEEKKDQIIECLTSLANEKEWLSSERESKIGYASVEIAIQLQLPGDVASDAAIHFVDAIEASRRIEWKQRVATLDYKIEEIGLSHSHDVNQFMKQTVTVAKWYEENNQLQDGPYFCLIQSSGMGKTKIMYHACKELDEKDRWRCSLVLPSEIKTGNLSPSNAQNVFKKRISLQGVLTKNKPIGQIVGQCFEELDQLVAATVGKEESAETPKNGFKHVFLCFDEAQAYLDSFEETEKEPNSQRELKRKHPSLLFRIIRLWLRKKRSDGIRIVACFAGTTANLNNLRFEFDDDKRLMNTAPSRDWTAKDVSFYDKGSEIFPVFTVTTTMGCITKTNQGSEYRKAIRYGRPLFAVLDANNALEAKLQNILGRMLLSKLDWEKNLPACLSVLATRMQMGQTTFSIASDLVANGYANLTSVSSGAARMCFMTDPVCARLAMRLMDPKFTCGLFNGKEPQWWVRKMAKLFSRGICSPEKGDFGEVMVAFYLLVCGDELRRPMSDETFSVSLDDWLGTVQCGGHPKKPVAPSSNARVTVNFIQVCRNYLRSYGDSWDGFKDQSFLKYVYESATAFYVFGGCPLIDMAGAIKISSPTTSEISFAPLFISIKSHHYFSPKQAKQECDKMLVRAAESGCTQALCLLIVFGSPTSSTDTDYAFDGGVAEKLVGNKPVARIIRIPDDDFFGVTDAFVELTSGGAAVGEVMASHPYIRANIEVPMVLEPQFALRRGEKDLEAKDILTALSKELRNEAWPTANTSGNSASN